MARDLASIVAKLREAQQKGRLGDLVGHEEAGKFSGDLGAMSESALESAFGASDLDALGGTGTGSAPSPAAAAPAPAPSVPGPGAPGGAVPGPGGAPAAPAAAVQGLGGAMQEMAPGAGWAGDAGGRGTPNALGRRTPVNAAMQGLRTAGRLY